MEIGVNLVEVESENQCIKRETVTNDMGKMERLIKLRFFSRSIETYNKYKFYVVPHVLTFSILSLIMIYLIEFYVRLF